jgi:O-antigen ligase
LFTGNNIQVTLGDYLNFISYIILFFIVLNFIKTEKEFNVVIKIFFVTSFLIAFYTLVQYYGFDPYYGYLGQLTSTIGQKNWISNYLAMIFPIAFSFFLLEKNKNNKTAYFILLVILYIALLICQSRGIWISIGITFIFAIFVITKYKLWILCKENKKWLFALLIIFIIITVIYSTENLINKSQLTVTERALSTFDVIQDPSINARFHIWRITFEMIKDSPVLGLGIGTYKYHYLNYQADYLQNHPQDIRFIGKAAEAHNEYLQLAAEIGIVGLGAFSVIIFLFYFSIYQYFERNKINENILVIIGLLMGITCFLIHCLFTFPFHVPVLGATFFILLALSIVHIHLTEENKKDYYKQNLITIKFNLNPILKYFSITLMILLVIFGAWKLAFKPYFAETYYLKGSKYFANQENLAALEYFEKAALFDSTNGRVLHALGSTYYQVGLQKEAQKTLDKVKTIYNDRNTYRNLGLSFMESGDIFEAEKELKHAIYLDPKFYQAYNDLASLYIYQNEYEKAIETWKKAVDLNLEFKEKHIFLYYIGLAYQRMDDRENAYNYFLKALKEAPDDSTILSDIEQELLRIFLSTNN